jgi:hypothetical protein
MPFPVTAGLLEPFGAGVGYQDTIAPANPGAGNNLAVVVEGRNWLRVLQAIATINTDATVANRFVSLDFINARGTTFSRNAAGLVVTASTVNQVFDWNEQRTDAQWATNTPVLAPVSSMFLAPATTIQITLDNKQAGDTITAVMLTVERYDTGPAGYPIGFIPTQ